MPTRVPLVDYLVLDDEPHLVARECVSCSARYFDRRSACASCFGTGFRNADIPARGTLRTYTIVATSAPGVPVPFVAAVVDCGGTAVRGNVVGVEPAEQQLKFGMPLRLTTFPIGTDDDGNEAICFGFEPDGPGGKDNL